MKDTQRIVTIGGGNGHSSLLAGLRHAGLRPTALVNVMDDGGSSGVLMHEYKLTAPGDLRRCIAALAPDDNLAKLWNYRFDHGVLAGHTVGNIVLVGAMLRTGRMQTAMDELGKLHHIHGEVLAITEDHAELIATLEDGTMIRGETNIDIPKHDANLHIQKLQLNPVPHTTARVKDALRSAQMVVLAPGDLYSSILPNLLVAGVVETLGHSNAHIVAIINRSTKRGETHSFSTHDFYNAYQQAVAPAKITTLIVDSATLPLPTSVEGVRHDATMFDDTDVTILLRDLADINNPRSIDGIKAARVIADVCASL